MKTPFLKMNGAGNRFLVLDLRRRTGYELDAAHARRLANPHGGSAFDQLIVMESNEAHPGARGDVFMRIYNADGSEVSACGNATRCVAWLLMQEGGKERISVETHAGLLACEREAVKRVRADMGPPRLEHALIPVAENVDLKNIEVEGLSQGIAVGLGNPHVVFFVPDVHSIDLARIGPLIEYHTDIFPERVNVSVAKIMDDGNIMLRVWERGAGITQACGTAACATLVAAVMRNLIKKRAADIVLPGGTLHVEWKEGGNVFLSGPVELQSEGEMAL